MKMRHNSKVCAEGKCDDRPFQIEISESQQELEKALKHHDCKQQRKIANALLA